MRFVYVSLAAGLAALAVPGTARAQSISFNKEIVPIFKEACVKCHNTRQAMGGFSVATVAAIEKGGKGGKEIVAGKPADSRLVKFLEGTLQPKMPVGGTLAKAQIDKIKAWITAGAKTDVDATTVLIPDTAIPVVKVPTIALKTPMLPQVCSLAWSKDDKILAIGTYKVVRLVDPADGSTIRELKGHADKIHALQFSPDGKYLAAAGGPESQQGEVKIWEVATGNLVKTLSGHNDAVYSVSWAPDNKTLATASYDKTIKIWDALAGTETKTLKDHADAVFAVAFNPSGTLLASGSADRSVKVWDVATGKRIYTLTGHTDIVFGLAWNKDGKQLTSVGADRTVRTWNVTAAAGNPARNQTPHEKTVTEVVYSPDGSMFATASEDKSVKVYNAGNGSTVTTIKDQPEAILSVAFSGDNTKVAVGSFDGSLKIFNAKDGKLLSTIIDLPKAPEPKKTEKADAKPDPKATKPAAKPEAAKGK